jgi:FtsP/CotA-like multicopper oxidase with cupredoxin domain
MTIAPPRLFPTTIPHLTREPREVHVDLEARETAWEISSDRTVSAWGYEGMVPGPTIVARVGDTLVVHLVNNLPEPTCIHWHGLRLHALMDGTELTQRLVQPGEAFEYRFELPDAGTFWYHSHANETMQIERVRLSIGGRPFRIIGTDGGLRDQPVTVTETLLPPAARVEIAVGPFDDEGAEIAIDSLPYPRTAMKRPRRENWATLRVGPWAPSVACIPPTLATIEPLVPAGPIQPTRTIRLGSRMTFHGHDWLINGEQHHHDAPVKVGELQVWQLVNETGMDHPFHLHGFFFQVIAIDGVPTVPKSWQDTVNIGGKGRVTIAFRPDDRPGKWMYHCHILEHHAAGMMGHFEVVR